MLDAIEVALRKYEEIAPDPSVAMTSPQAEQLGLWLEIDVGEITGSLLSLPEFRRRARWPMEKLTGSRACEERAAVMAVDRALVQHAKRLAAFAKTASIRQQLTRLGPHLEEIEPTDAAAVPPGLEFVEFLSTRPWKDLVSPSDYFRSVAQFNYQDGETEQWAEFTAFVNPRLRPPGDFVSRCMEIRVEAWCSALRRFHVRCDTARQRASLASTAEWDRVVEAGAELAARFEVLRNLCFHGTAARERDACMALLQVHVAFRPSADLEWLGDVREYSVNAAGIPHEVTSQHQWDVPERIAQALIDIRDLVRRPQCPDDIIAEMLTKHRLVLVDGSREGFLDGRPVSRDENTNWDTHAAAWEFLWMSAVQATRRQVVDRMCLSNFGSPRSRKPPSVQSVRDRRGDLKKLIIPELDELLVDAGNGSYRLMLEPGEICFLKFETDERLVQFEPQPARPEGPDGLTSFVRMMLSPDDIQ